MKVTSLIKHLSLLSLILVLGASSCKKEQPYIGEIPNAKHIICNAGDRPTLSFYVEGNWQLSSDVTWCKFITSAGEVQDMSGKAGSHTVTLRITDENIKNEPSFANITMKMGSNIGIIATVERGPNKLYMRIYDITDTPIEAVEIGYIDWIPFRIEANFRFALVDYPEWIEFEGDAVTGVPGEQTEAMVRIIADGVREQFPFKKDEGHYITFSDESGETTFDFPIEYNGMSNFALTFEGPTANNFGWEVSLDGKSFRQTDESTGTAVIFEDGLEFSITSSKHDYEILLFEKVVDRGIPTYEVDVDWMEFNKETSTLKVKATNSTRHGMVMAIPRGTYNKIRADIKGNIFELDYTSGIGLETVVYDYLPFVLIEFTQKDFNERSPYEGMYVYHSLTTYEIPCTSYTDADVIATYGAEEAFTCPFPLPRDGKTPSIIIDPRIESWTTDTFTEGRASAEFWYRGEQLKTSEGEYEMGENKDEVMAAQLFGPSEGFSEEVYVVFKLDGVAKKLLVVTPPIE